MNEKGEECVNIRWMMTIICQLWVTVTVPKCLVGQMTFGTGYADWVFEQYKWLMEWHISCCSCIGLTFCMPCDCFHIGMWCVRLWSSLCFTLLCGKSLKLNIIGVIVTIRRRGGGYTCVCVCVCVCVWCVCVCVCVWCVCVNVTHTSFIIVLLNAEI